MTLPILNRSLWLWEACIHPCCRCFDQWGPSKHLLNPLTACIFPLPVSLPGREQKAFPAKEYVCPFCTVWISWNPHIFKKVFLQYAGVPTVQKKAAHLDVAVLCLAWLAAQGFGLGPGFEDLSERTGDGPARHTDAIWGGKTSRRLSKMGENRWRVSSQLSFISSLPCFTNPSMMNCFNYF